MEKTNNQFLKRIIINKINIYLLSLVTLLGNIIFSSGISFGQDSIRIVLEDIYDNDQAVRSQYRLIEEKIGIEQSQIDCQRNKVIKSDSLNLQIVKRILDDYGFLGFSKVGEKAASAEWLVIQHSTDLALQEKWLPIIWMEAEKEEIFKYMAAMLEDRIRVMKGMKQLYGTQKIWDAKKRRYITAPIEDEENLNERRKEVGLSYN